jgi:hypothetical protein
MNDTSGSVCFSFGCRYFGYTATAVRRVFGFLKVIKVDSRIHPGYRTSGLRYIRVAVISIIKTGTKRRVIAGIDSSE